ncbi:hypothetical protein [Streptomyces sp. NBC_01304]|uniref:hypothetical protein n=1 Tax=Streptomyces sp. NBC_01304 TaxID=2903818 RepID=UPI002E0E8355|nr:hypothetical protein OG430_21600 [Streptomyces sp. NBC_01304]
MQAHQSPRRITRREWGVGGSERALCAVLLGVLLVGDVLGDTGPLETACWAAGYLAVLGLVFRSRVAVTEDQVVVRGLLRSRGLPLRELTEVRAGWTGLTVRAGDRRLICVAMAKTNMAKWLGREPRADRIAAQILAAAQQARTADAHSRSAAPEYA